MTVQEIQGGDEVSIQIKDAVWSKCTIINCDSEMIEFEYLLGAGKGNIIVSTEPYTITKIKPKDEEENTDKVD